MSGDSEMSKDKSSTRAEYALVLAVGFLQGCAFYASYRYSPFELPFLTAALLPVPFYLVGKKDGRFREGMTLWGMLLVLTDLGQALLRQPSVPDFKAFALPFAVLAVALLLLPSFLARMEEGTFFPPWGTFCAIVLRVLFAAALAAAVVAQFWFLYGLAPHPAPSSLLELWEAVKVFPDAIERALLILNIGSWTVAAPVLYWASHRSWLPKAATGKGAVLLPCLLFSAAAAIVWYAWLTAAAEVWKDPDRKREWVAGLPVFGGNLSEEARLRVADRVASLRPGRRDGAAFFLLADLDGDGNQELLFHVGETFYLLVNDGIAGTRILLRDEVGNPCDRCLEAASEGEFRTLTVPWKILEFPEMFVNVFPMPLVEGRTGTSEWEERYRGNVEGKLREWLLNMPAFGGNLSEEDRLECLKPLSRCFSPLTFDRNARAPFFLLEDFDGDGNRDVLVHIGGYFFLMQDGRAFEVEWAFMEAAAIPLEERRDYREEVAAGRYRLLPNPWRVLEIGERRFWINPRDYGAIRREKRETRLREEQE